MTNYLDLLESGRGNKSETPLAHKEKDLEISQDQPPTISCWFDTHKQQHMNANYANNCLLVVKSVIKPDPESHFFLSK